MTDDVSNSWQECKQDFTDRVLPSLKKHGKQIGADAAQGTESAKKVMSYYALLYRSFDPVIADQVEESLSAWLKQRGTP